ncbi:MAG: sterol desaturase family protein [Spirochaetia bacterium]|nr:sterol desaturase family protein [Spirochaetia bacterium]
MILNKILVAALAGALSWPLLEYVLHRYLGHQWRVRTGFRREHTRHHAQGGYFAPAWKKVVAASIVIAAAVLIGLATGFLEAAAAWTVSLMLAYGFYEWYHLRLHLQPPRGRISMLLARHYLAHHFTNPKKNFGVTSTLYDHLFGTYELPEIIRVPSSLAMPWLKAAPEAYAGIFQISVNTTVASPDANPQ